MTAIMTAFGPMVAMQILYSLLFLAGAAVVFAAMDRMSPKTRLARTAR